MYLFVVLYWLVLLLIASCVGYLLTKMILFTRNAIRANFSQGVSLALQVLMWTGMSLLSVLGLTILYLAATLPLAAF